ncbi:MAG: SsrA-binding protein, partial [Bacteroidota bacterium]
MIAKGPPVDSGIGHVVGIEIASCSSKLGFKWNLQQTAVLNIKVFTERLVEMYLAKGKQAHDKRDAIKDRDWARD